MARIGGKGRMSTVEMLFLGAFFFVYAFLILSSDPEWLTWAGPVVLGAFPIAAAPPMAALDPMETVQAAAYASLPGLLAAIVLLAFRGRARVRPPSGALGQHEPAPIKPFPGARHDRKAA